MQSDLWQGDVIPKTEYAHQWSPNLHNEETSTSASNIFDISNLELCSSKVKYVDRDEKRKEWKQRALSVCEEGTQSWTNTHTHTHNFVSQKHKGSFDFGDGLKQCSSEQYKKQTPSTTTGKAFLDFKWQPDKNDHADINSM